MTPTPSSPDNPRPRRDRRQAVAVVVVLVCGALAAAAILNTTPGGAAASDDHDHGPAVSAHAPRGEDPHADDAHDDDAHDGNGHGNAASGADGHGHSNGNGHGNGNGNANGTGPHGGELVTTGELTLEVLLAEPAPATATGPVAGVDAAPADGARLTVWPSWRGLALPLDALTLEIELTQPGRASRRFGFDARGAALVAREPIPEPHTFDGRLLLRTDSASHELPLSRREGLIAMSSAQRQAAGITIERAAPARLRTTLVLPGEIRFNEDLTAHVVPRVAGIVEAVPVALGATVRKGQVLAVISSPVVSEQRAELKAAQRRLDLARTVHRREQRLWQEKISPEQDVQAAEQALREAEIAVDNARQKLRALGVGTGAVNGELNRFELRAPFDGTVVEKHIALGEQVRDDSAVFTVSDLGSVWAEFNVPASDLPQVRVGEPVTVRATAFEQSVGGEVAYVGSLIGEQTRTAPARAPIANPDLAWRPGLYVDVELVADDSAAPVAVAADAIQTIDNQPVVFALADGGFVAVPVKLGRHDGGRVEIVAGLDPGARYAGRNSFIVKSEAGKASASHSH